MTATELATGIAAALAPDRTLLIMAGGTGGHALRDQGCHVNADRCHVARDLAAGLLEGEIKHPFAAFAGGGSEVCRQAALAGAGGAGD